jgi:hypothetical protein
MVRTDVHHPLPQQGAPRLSLFFIAVHRPLLAQVDIFKERILVSSIKAYFPDYTG